MRLLPLDGAYRVEVQTASSGLRSYRKRRDGTIHTTEADGRALIREGLASPANAAGPTAHIAGGFTCVCGRRNYFRRCAACGEES